MGSEMAKKRDEIAESLTWDLTTIFKNDEAWEAELAELQEKLESVEQYEGHLLDSAHNLLEITEVELELSQAVEKVYVYASMKHDQDTQVSLYQEYEAKATNLYAKFSERFAFYEPEFLELTQKDYEKFLEEEPKLKQYAHMFERLFAKKAHVLTQKEEKLLASAGEIFGAAADTFEIFDNADINLPVVKDDKEEIQLTHGNYISLMESKDRKVRKAAYQALYSNYEQYQHTYAKTLQTNVKVHNFMAKARGYSSARQAALSNNFIPEKVYDKLLEAVNKHLPLLHRYMRLREQILGLEGDLKMYDVYTPLSNLDYKFNYEAAVQKAQEILGVYGTEYSVRVKKAFDERWIDVEENIGKRSGAYSGGSYDTNAFMLLNWQETLDDLFTLVHEMGHSMHSTFTRENQPYAYGDYPIFLAEIASTTNENLLTESLLAETEGEKERFAILNHWLDGFRGTVFRQSQFAEFEHDIHKADQEGTVLTSEFMNNLYAELNEKYYGLSAKDNPEIQYEWARIPHFYYNYYVFQYATGFAAASYLAENILHNGESAREKYLNYLKAGSSDYPLAVIAKAGVDMEGSEYLDSAFAVFEKRLSELEKLVEKGVHL